MNKNFYKLLSLILVIGLPGIVFTGCGNQSNGEDGGNDDSVTLTIWDFYGTTTPIQPLIPKFEEENPNIKIDFQAQPWENYWEKLAAGASGGTLPDLATTGLMWAPQYVDYGVYADLTPLSNGKINGEDIESVYSKGMLDAAEKEGRLYGIPYDFDAYALYYRKDLLEDAGVENPPKNWNELVSEGKKLTKDTNGDGKTDQYAYVVQADWPKWEPFLYGNGGSILNEDNTEAVFNSPEGVEALQFYSDLVNKYGIAIYWSADQGNYISGMKDGTIAMAMDGPYVMGSLKESAPELDGSWGVAHPIENNQFGTHIGGTYLSIFENSEHKEEAWQFIEFLSREDNQIELYKTSGAAPAYLPAIQNEEINEPDPYFGNEKPLPVFKEVVEQGRPNPIVPEWQQIADILNNALEKAILEEATPKDALDEAAQKVNELLAE